MNYSHSSPHYSPGFKGGGAEKRELSREINEFKEEISSGSLNEKTVNDHAQRIAKYLVDLRKVKYHQLRRIFSVIKSAESERELVLAKAKIAYQNRVIQNREFVGLYLGLVDAAITESRFKEFLYQFNEAIVAYFKYYKPSGQ